MTGIDGPSDVPSWLDAGLWKGVCWTAFEIPVEGKQVALLDALVPEVPMPSIECKELRTDLSAMVL